MSSLFDIKDINFKKLNLKPGDTLVMSFAYPNPYFELDEIYNMYTSIKSVLPENIIFIAKPKSIDLEVEK